MRCKSEDHQGIRSIASCRTTVHYTQIRLHLDNPVSDLEQNLAWLEAPSWGRNRGLPIV